MLDVRLKQTFAGGLPLLLLGAAPERRVEIPSTFRSDTVYVELTSAAGRRFELYTDSGGGSLIIARRAAERLGMTVTGVKDPEALAELGPDAGEAPSPTLEPGLPPLPGRAFVVTAARQIADWPEQGDGVVGAAWFAGAAWTWDYPAHRLIREASGWKPGADATTLPLGFKVERDGERSTNFASVIVTIDGRPVAMLLDTGAETFLTEDAAAALGDGGPRLRATSMIRAGLFDAWRRDHPDWRAIEHAQAVTGADMILVPDVRIGDLASGPVWFTRRSDDSFLKFMSSMTDRPVDGSVGGNALHRFRMTIDYPAATMSLTREKVTGALR